MSRFSPYLGIVAALALGIFISVFSGSTTVSRIPIIIPIASPTTPEVVVASTKSVGATTSVQTHSSVSKKIPASSTPAAVAVTPPTAESIAALNAALDTSALILRSALVNIICYAPARSGIHSISGSGVIIDPKGIILTNAHVAQYFLLADRDVSCTIRSGSPATDSYNAALAYISPAWLKANPTVLTKTTPSGTGEYDFAFLAITKSATDSKLPSIFPYMTLSTTPPKDTPVVIASYGSQFLEASQITNGLFPTIVFGSVKDVLTFGTNTIDVLALGGSAAAQEGSSGGGVADVFRNLVGTITTSTITGTTDTRSLDAITASYIRGEYASETGQALDLLLAESPATAVADFAPRISELESIITANLP
ncbi:MAG: serine protease [Candidatus Kaiserbacteria bacterium]|nr:serine protease [Candidatus Kaiserbacteria bacterium]